MIHTQHWYMLKWPDFNRVCAECGQEFNALYVKPRTRLTCSHECSIKHTDRIRRENTRRYVATPEYKERNKIRNREYRQMVMVTAETLNNGNGNDIV